MGRKKPDTKHGESGGPYYVDAAAVVGGGGKLVAAAHIVDPIIRCLDEADRQIRTVLALDDAPETQYRSVATDYAIVGFGRTAAVVERLSGQIQKSCGPRSGPRDAAVWNCSLSAEQNIAVGRVRELSNQLAAWFARQDYRSAKQLPRVPAKLFRPWQEAAAVLRASMQVDTVTPETPPAQTTPTVLREIPPDVLKELSRQHQSVVRYLWEHSPCQQSALESAVWENPVQPATVEQSLRRLETAFNGAKLRAHGLHVKWGKGHVTLIRPDKNLT